MTDYNKGYRPVSLTETFMGINSSSDNTSPSSVMHETLLSQPPSTLPVATSRPMMEVVAPADLPEGYEFEVQLNDNNTKFKVQVPPGGIERGQTFSVPYPEPSNTTTTNTTTTGGSTAPAAVSIPVGHWRDDLFDCFRHGICHPHCWASWLCTFLATGQVIRRMKFDWTGHPTDNSNKQALAFPLIFGMVVLYFVIHLSLYLAVILLDPNVGHYDDPNWTEKDPEGAFLVLLSLYQTFGFVYWILSTIVLIRTRRSVRERYAIPAQDFEDCMCSVCCHCCVAGQLLRHTTDYDVYPSVIFTDTGLPKHVAAIV